MEGMPEIPDESEIVDDLRKAEEMAHASDMNHTVYEIGKKKGQEDQEHHKMTGEFAEAQEISAGIEHEMKMSGSWSLEALREAEQAIKEIKQKYNI